MSTRTTLRAWIEEVITIEGVRYRVVHEGILFPGRRNATMQTWASREGARKYIARMRETYVVGVCPLPAVTEAEREAYRREAAARRARVAAKQEA